VTPILELPEADAPPQELVTVVGAITALAQRTTRRGELMASLRLEDLQAGIEVMVFPKTMAE
jgi:DNA polymerase-3 subunit alpha